MSHNIRRTQPVKIDDQKALSTENTTMQLVRLYEDWQRDKRQNKTFQDQIERYLSGINDKSLPKDVNIAYYIVQKAIEGLELALGSEVQFMLSQINSMINDFTDNVENSTFKRITDDLKKRGKVKIISLFRNVYHEMKAVNQGIAAKIKLRFIFGFLDIAIDAREIYDSGLGAEVRNPFNIEKFIENEETPPELPESSNENKKPKRKAI